MWRESSFAAGVPKNWRGSRSDEAIVELASQHLVSYLLQITYASRVTCPSGRLCPGRSPELAVCQFLAT
jgi:hypothetical protein